MNDQPMSEDYEYVKIIKQDDGSSVIYVDTGSLSDAEALAFVKEIEDKFKKNQALSKVKVTGRLENWSKDPYFKVIWGDLYDDVHQRWPDGTRIHTSDIKKKEGDLVYTRNSIYRLGKKQEETK